MSNNTRITDLEPVNMDEKDESLDNPIFVHDDKLMEIISSNDDTNYKVTISKLREMIVGQMYPVGSIYQSTEPDNPAKVLGMPNSTWRLYGNSVNSVNGKGAPAAMFGYDEHDSKFTASESIRGVDTDAIINGYIDPIKHWGWRRLRISNFEPHNHTVNSVDSVWAYGKKEKIYTQNDNGIDEYTEKVVWENVDSMDMGVRHGYGILTSLPPVIDTIIEKRNLGTTTTNILKDPRVDEVKINGETVKVDTNKRQFVTYDGVTYIYTTVAQMKSKNKDGSWAINGGTTNVNKWLPDQTSNQSHTLDQNKYLGEIPIPSSNSKTTGLKNPAYSPIANPVTKSGTVRIKFNNAAGYKDISDIVVGNWVNYTDSEGNTTQIVFSKDYDVTETTKNNNKTVSVKIVNKWVPYHEVWQNKYWGRINNNVNITVDPGIGKPGLTLSQEKNNSDVTLGFYGTVLQNGKKITAHAGDILAYKNAEYIYNPVEGDADTLAYINTLSIQSGGDAVYDIRNIYQNEWAREDSGVDIMTKMPDGTPEDYDVGQDAPRNMIRNERDDSISAALSEVTVSDNGYESKKWDTGGTLRLVGNDVLARVFAGYGIYLWPDEVTGFPKAFVNSLAEKFNQLDDTYRMSHGQSPLTHNEAYEIIAEIRSEINSKISSGTCGINNSTKTEYAPEAPVHNYNLRTGELQNKDEIDSWTAHTVDNWDNISNGAPFSDSHTVGTIVSTLPPYVTAYRWVRIS